jgi:hypothetical protein
MPVSPRDFYPPPIDYSAGERAGEFLGTAIGNIPQNIREAQAWPYKLRELQYQEQLRAPLVDENGNAIIDPGRLAQEFAKRGNAAALEQIYPWLVKGQFMAQPDPLAAATGARPAETEPPPPRPVPPSQPAAFPASGPSAITGEFEPPQPPARISGDVSGAPAPTGPQGSQTAAPASGIQPSLTAPPPVIVGRAPQDMPGASLTPPGWLRGGTVGGYPPTPQGFADYALAEARRRSIIDPEGAKTLAARGQAVLDQIKQDAALTPEQKNARASGFASPLQFEGAKTEATTRAEADTKYIQDIAKQAYEATNRNAQLDAIDQLGQRVAWGPQAKAAEWIGEHLGIETKGYNDIRAYQAAINYLAPRLRPEGQGRLMSWELEGFKDAIGGLNSTPQGRRLLIQNLKLVNNYAVDMGHIANNPNLSNAQKRIMMDRLQPPQLPVPVHNAKEYEQLPPGHPYLHPDGTVRTKPITKSDRMQ